MSDDYRRAKKILEECKTALFKFEKIDHFPVWAQTLAKKWLAMRTLTEARMGNKYTVQVYGKHFGESEPYCYIVHWAGESVVRALWELWRASRIGYWCVTLECR